MRRLLPREYFELLGVAFPFTRGSGGETFFDLGHNRRDQQQVLS